MSISQSNSHVAASRLLAGARKPLTNAVKVDQTRRVEALERLLAVNGTAERSQVLRFLDFSQHNEINLDLMWSLQDETGQLTHTVLAVPSPGRTAMFFASHPINDVDIECIADLIAHTAQAVGKQHIHLAQALLDPLESLERKAFAAGGFTDLARLSYMERPVSRSDRSITIDWPENVQPVQYDDTLETGMLQVLEASYEQTLDCPSLRGLRETADILKGHRSTGEFDPSLWTMLFIDDQPAGALLLNPSPTQKSIELVYIGLAKHARGRGLGRRLLRHGFALVATRRERTINLAVDERNKPAVSMYTTERFRRVLRRIAMICPLRELATHSR